VAKEDSTGGGHPLGGSNPGRPQSAARPAASAKDLLERLKDAVRDLAVARSRDREVQEAGEAVGKIVLERQRQAGDSVNPETLSELIHATPQQQKIEEIRAQIKSAELNVLDRWDELQPALDRLRSNSKSMGLFQALDTLASLLPGSKMDRRIALVEQILRASVRNPREGTAKHGGDEAEIKRVKVLIKSLHHEGLSHREICDRLDASDCLRPKSAKWSRLPYRKAYDSTDFHDAVKTWLSKAIHK
jgi:hypothetical protein